MLVFRGLKRFLILLFLIGIISFSALISAAGINDTLHINVQTTYSNGSIETGTFDFSFNLTESSGAGCGSPIVYNHTISKTTDSRGIVSIYLPTTGSGGGNLSSLGFDKQYYICYYRDGNLEDVSQLGRIPYSFKATQVNISELTSDANLTLTGFNVSASSGFFTGIIRALGNFITNSTNNATLVGENVAGNPSTGSPGNHVTAIGRFSSYKNNQNSSTTVGYQAGYFNTGDSQTAIGYLAGYNNTGASQTAIGYQAGYNNTGTQQTAIGYLAGYNNTATVQTAIGYQAGYFNNVTSQTAVGYFAGRQNAGTFQTAVGREAGYFNSGSYQTAIGYLAGYQNSAIYQTTMGYLAGYGNTGAQQTAIGYLAGYQNNVTSQTAVGSSAGYNNTGIYQLAIGYFTGYLNTGDYQTAIGYDSGYLNTGDNQTAVGYFAGYNNTGNNVVAIGHEAGKDNSDDNLFILKHSRANSVPLIQGNFSSGRVGINTTTPQNALNVFGDLNVTSTSSFGGNVALNAQNITNVDCITFNSGGRICSA